MKKLVRDRIPEIIRQDGGDCETRIIEGLEYKEALKDKLCEEILEFLRDNSIEEMADVLEVLDAFIEFNGWTKEEVLEFKDKKQKKKGGFKKRIFIEK